VRGGGGNRERSSSHTWKQVFTVGGKHGEEKGRGLKCLKGLLPQLTLKDRGVEGEG